MNTDVYINVARSNSQMWSQSLPNEILDGGKLHAQIQKVLIWYFFGAVHPLMVVQRKHDIPVVHASGRQNTVGALPTSD